MRRIRRRALVVLSLAIAATYLSAWIDAYRRPVELASNAPGVPTAWPRRTPDHWPPVESAFATPGAPPSLVILVAYTPTAAEPSGFIQHRQELRRAGWPLLALERSDTYDYSFSSNQAPGLPPPRLSLERGVGLPSWAQRPACPTLPLRPMWAGFSLNAGAFAAALAACLYGPSTIRTARTRARQHRGECTRCRYPIGTLAICPECGRQSSPA